MKNRYIDALTAFSPKELVHKFEDIEYDGGHDRDFIIYEGFLGGKDIKLIRHNWEMYAMYHSLRMYKLAYIYSGTFIIYTDGKPTVLPQGTLCIVPPDIVQKFTIDYSRGNTADTVMINILLRSSRITELLPQVFARKNEVSDYLSKTIYENSFPIFLVLRTPSEFSRDIAEMFFTEVISSVERKAPIDTAISLLNALIFSYFKTPGYIAEPSVTTSDGNEPVNRIINCIRNEFRDITLSSLCERFHYTPSYICRIIKKHTGMTFKECINSEKLECACKNLLLTDKSIRDIASESGWNTLEYFYRVFHKKYGITPQKFRDREQKAMKLT